MFGTGIAFLSVQNGMPVTLNFMQYSFPDLALSYVIIGSVLVGVLMAYMIYLIHSISTAITIRGKNKRLKHEKQESTALTKKVHQLELENARIKNENEPSTEDKRSL